MTSVADVLNAALSDYDEAMSVCPVNNPGARRGGFDRTKPCPICRARQDQSCGREASASYVLIKRLRSAAQQAAHSPSEAQMEN